MWDLSCRDWEARLRAGTSLVPALPLFRAEAETAVRFWDELRLPDVSGNPRLAEAGGQWFRDIVAALFGARDPATNHRFIEEIFLLVAKKNSKTTDGAALMLVALLMNVRPLADFMFIGPTQAISDLAFSQADGMIRLDPELDKRFHIRGHTKEIVDRVTGAKLRVKTFGLEILTGPRPAGVLLDELHLLGRNPDATKVLRQLRGGRQATPEGFLVITTTQSDEPPAGVFRDELMTARAIRDGRRSGVMLPVLYEFPHEIARDEALWQDPANWPMVLPNLELSLRLDALVQDWESERQKGDGAIRIWASQHLNIEIGLALRSDRWAGADFWEAAAAPELARSLDALISLADVATVGIDGGGLDDLLGLAVIGRMRETRRWLLWTHAWAHASVLERRKSEAARLLDFAADGDLTIIEKLGDDVMGVAEIVERLDQAGLLPEKSAVGVDPVGISEIVDELSMRGIGGESERVVGVPQGWKLANAIKTAERRLASRELVHCARPMMAWCVGNAKAVPRGNAIMIDKQVSGAAKIDPLIAAFNAVALMAMNPEAVGGPSVYDTRGVLLVGAPGADASAEPARDRWSFKGHGGTAAS